MRSRSLDARSASGETTRRPCDSSKTSGCGEYDPPGFVADPGWSIVDIGANVGIYALLCCSRGARVVCYEPGPEAFERLAVHTRGAQIQVNQAAVVADAGMTYARLYLRERHTRNSLLPDVGAPVTAGAVDVPAVSIQEVLASPCDLVKIDTEGTEYALLESAGEALRNAERIICELDADAVDPGEVVTHVEGLGFRVTLHPAYPSTTFHLMTAVLTR